MIYEDGKATVTSSVESLMLDHFSQVASIYSQYRTFDHELINYITKKLASMSNIVAADIGCGDGRYSIKLIEKLRNRLSLPVWIITMKCYDKFLIYCPTSKIYKQSMPLPKSCHLMTTH